MNNPQTMPMSPNQSQTMPAGGLNFNSLGGFGGGGLGYAAAKAPTPPQVQLGGLQAPVPATAAGVQQAKTASQDSSKKQRSSTGEDSGVKYKHSTEGHLTQADAFKSLDGYMKSAGFNSFQSAFFGSLISRGFNSAQITHYTKQASAQFDREVGSELELGLEKLEKSAFSMGLLGKGLKHVGSYFGSKALKNTGRAAMQNKATAGSTLRTLGSELGGSARNLAQQSTGHQAMNAVQGGIAGATNPNRDPNAPLSTRAFDATAGALASVVSPTARNMARRANAGQAIGGAGAFTQGALDPAEQTMRSRFDTGLQELMNPDNKFRQYGYNVGMFSPNTLGKSKVPGGLASDPVRYYPTKLTSGYRAAKTAPGWLEKIITNPVNRQVGKVKDLAIKYPKVSIPVAATAGAGTAYAGKGEYDRRQGEINSLDDQYTKLMLENVLSQPQQSQGEPVGQFLTPEQEQELFAFDPNRPATFENEEAKQRYLNEQRGLLPESTSQQAEPGSNPETNPDLLPFDQKSDIQRIELEASPFGDPDGKNPAAESPVAESPVAESSTPPLEELPYGGSPEWLQELIGPQNATFVANNKDWLLPLLLSLGGAGVGGLVDGQDGALLGGLLGAGGGAASSMGLIPGFNIGNILGFKDLTPEQQKQLGNIGAAQLSEKDKNSINSKIDTFAADGLDASELGQLQEIPGALGAATERTDFNELVASFMNSEEESPLKDSLKPLQRNLFGLDSQVADGLARPVGQTTQVGFGPVGGEVQGLGISKNQALKLIKAVQASAPKQSILSGLF